MKSKHPEMMAAWAVAIVLVALVAFVPWHKLGANVPVGVVDPAQQRYVPEISLGASPDELHYHESRFTTFGPEGI